MGINDLPFKPSILKLAVGYCRKNNLIGDKKHRLRNQDRDIDKRYVCVCVCRNICILNICRNTHTYIYVGIIVL